MIRISEIFQSVQGEGRFTGTPSVFIRTSGCNLRCWFCDTRYASWEPEGDSWEVSTIVAAATKWNTEHVVITGGEPMIFDELGDICKELRQMNRHITIETAGTILPNGIPCDLASLSPKLSNSTPPASRDSAWAKKHESTRLQPEVISEWIRKYAFQLKFVVSSENDLVEIKSLLLKLPKIPADRVLLMPEGIDSKTLASRSPWLVDICKREGFRFCPRLHIELFGHKRGT